MMGDKSVLSAWPVVKSALLGAINSGDHYSDVIYPVFNTKSDIIPGTRIQVWKDFVYSILDKYTTPGGSVMETACASGVTTALLSEQGYSMVACDIDKKMIERAEKHRNIMVDSESPSFGLFQSGFTELAENLKKKPELPQMYDVVMCFGAIYYILEKEELVKAFQNFADILRPGGALFIENRSFHSILERGYAMGGGKNVFDTQTVNMNVDADPATQLVEIDPYVIYGPEKVPLVVYMDYRWADGSSRPMLFNPLMPDDIRDLARETFGEECNVTSYHDLDDNHLEPVNAFAQHYVIEKPI